MPASPYPTPRLARTLEFALFGTAIIWVVAAQAIAASAARGLVTRFDLASQQMLLSSILFIFLLALGFTLLQIISGGPRQLREVLGLPRRATAAREWGIGAALGWGTVLAAVLPIALFARLYPHFFPDGHAFALVLSNLVLLLVAALAEEIAFRGFAFRRLIDATGPVTATLATSAIFGLVHALNPSASWISVLITALAGVLFCVSWLRTHGLWLGWGMHFAWNASMGILFGLPVSGIRDFSSVIRTHAVGLSWITGGPYGPEAAFFTIFVILAAIPVLVFATRDYAWDYTRPPLIPGGYPLDVAPPPAHVAMEAEALARPTPLVQILPTTPGTMSVQSTPSAPPPPPVPNLEDPS